MIWATVSSQSCFCWLYKASSLLAAKNIINLILILTIWWCPYVVFSCVVGRGCLLWPLCSLDKTLLAFDLLCFVLQGYICLLLHISWLPTFSFKSPIMNCRVGPLKMDGSWWRVLKKRSPLEKRMANHFSILALRTPWTVWKGKKLGHWKMNSPGR